MKRIHRFRELSQKLIQRLLNSFKWPEMVWEAPKLPEMVWEAPKLPKMK